MASSVSFSSVSPFFRQGLFEQRSVVALTESLGKGDHGAVGSDLIVFDSHVRSAWCRRFERFSRSGPAVGKFAVAASDLFAPGRFCLQRRQSFGVGHYSHVR
jgi:hypothetical protein